MQYFFQIKAALPFPQVRLLLAPPPIDPPGRLSPPLACCLARVPFAAPIPPPPSTSSPPRSAPHGVEEVGLFFFEGPFSPLNGSFVFHIQAGGGLVQQDDRAHPSEKHGRWKCADARRRKERSHSRRCWCSTCPAAFRQIPRSLPALPPPRTSSSVAPPLRPRRMFFEDRVVKQGHILKHNGIKAHQFFRVDLGNLHAAHGDAAPSGNPRTVLPAGKQWSCHRRRVRTSAVTSPCFAVKETSLSTVSPEYRQSPHGRTRYRSPDWSAARCRSAGERPESHSSAPHWYAWR